MRNKNLAALLLCLSGCCSPENSPTLTERSLGIELLAVKASAHERSPGGAFTLPVLVRLTNQTSQTVSLDYLSLANVIHRAELVDAHGDRWRISLRDTLVNFGAGAAAMIWPHSEVRTNVVILCGEKPIEIVNARLMTNPPDYKTLREVRYRIHGRAMDPENKRSWYVEGSGRVPLQ